MGVDVKLGRAVLDLVTDPTKLRAGLAAARAESISTLQAAQATLHSIGSQMTQTGSQLTKGVTVPVLGIGAAIYHVAGDFQTSMDHIVGLVGIGRAQVNAWVPEIEALGVATGKGPDELAKALYFITSAGLRGQAALDALTAAAKASAAGLGETAVVADAVTSAVNSYAKSGLTATNATDVLVAAVRDGKVAAADLAPELGRLLPIASSMGISFSQVAGTMAVMTRTGLDAAGAATSISAIMTALIKPSKGAQDALAGVGLNMADLRKEAAEGPEGLVNVMRKLSDAFGGNDDELVKVIPNVRAFRGVMNVLGQDSGVVSGVLNDVAHAAGLTDTAFQAVADSAQFKVDQALSKLQDDAITLGQDVLPLVVQVIDQIAGAVHGAVTWFEALDPATRQNIVSFLGIAAVVGPLLVVLGALVGAVGGLIGAFTGLYGFLTVTLIPFVVGALTAAWAGFAAVLFATDIPALMALGVAMVGVEVAAAPLLLVLGALVLIGGAVVAAVNGATSATGRLAEANRLAGMEATRTRKSLEDTRREHGLTADGTAFLADQVTQLTAAQQAQADAANLAADAEHRASEHADELRDAMGPVAYDMAKAADAAKQYAKDQAFALNKALTDEQKFTSDALATIRTFRTDMENVFKGAKDAALDAADTALAIAEKSAELAADDKAYKALRHATALQTEEYKNRRLHILAELSELKLHALLIGTAMDQELAIQSLLTSQDMADGLTSRFPEVKASYESLRDTALQHLYELATQGGAAGLAAAQDLQKWLDPSNPSSPLHNAGTWGGLTATAWAQALAAAIRAATAPTGAITTALHTVATRMIASSPPGPESPLHYIDVWGERTGMAWVLPLVGAIAKARDLLLPHLGAIGAALQAGPSSLGAAAGGLAVAGGTPAASHLGTALAATAGAGNPLIGVLNIEVDARGHANPAAVGAAVKQGVADAMADVFRDQSRRGIMEPAI